MRARLGRLAAAISGALGCGGMDGSTTPWMPTTTVAQDDGDDSTAADDAADDDGSTAASDDDETTFADPTSDGTTAPSDSTGTIDCSPPDPTPAWLADDLRDTVARLSGETEIQPGVVLSDRATAQRRAQAAAWMLQKLGEIGLQGESHDYGSGTNVYARVPATMASHGTFVVGAHYDSVPQSPGADDNATGTAIVLALARHLESMPCRYYDVIVVAFDEEELGLVGSTAFAAKLVQDQEPVVAVHTVDQAGWDADGDRRVELEKPDEGLFDFYADASAELAAPIELVPTNTGFTDHESFRAAGFLAVGLSEEYASGDTTPHYHQSSDRYDTVDFAYLESNATLVNHAFARVLAGS